MRKRNEGLYVMFCRLLEKSSYGPSIALGWGLPSPASRSVSVGATLCVIVSGYLSPLPGVVCGWSGELRPTSPGDPGASMARGTGDHCWNLWKYVGINEHSYFLCHLGPFFQQFMGRLQGEQGYFRSLCRRPKNRDRMVLGFRCRRQGRKNAKSLG